MDFIKSVSEYLNMLMETIEKVDASAVNDILNLICEARDNQKQIFIMGNGGSGANASHITGDFNKGLSLGMPENQRFRVLCLNDNVATTLSLANDVSYADIFVEQLKNFLNPDDIVIGISGSGNSENILKAARYAQERGNKVIGFTGFDGGELKKLADLSYHIDSYSMQIVEDLHMMLGHLFYHVLKK